jgi:AraC-like DNA-binding protein
MQTDQAEEIMATVRGFERLLGVRICLSDYTGRFARYLDPDVSFHSNRFCQCVKDSTRVRHLCARFDNQIVPAELRQRGAPFWKCCYSGVVELVLPLKAGDVIVGSAAWGQFRLANKQTHRPVPLVEAPGLVGVLRRRENRHLWEALPILDRSHSEALMSVGQAFAARIEQLIARSLPDSGQAANRQRRILAYLGRNFNRPLSLEDLAREIHLSVSRTGEVVREAFGKPFVEVLQDERLRHAEDLLAHTSFPVLEVAVRCGYADPAYFHRVFRRRKGQTPRAFRLSRQRRADAVREV